VKVTPSVTEVSVHDTIVPAWTNDEESAQTPVFDPSEPDRRTS
jgi:hypothetical protein